MLMFPWLAILFGASINPTSDAGEYTINPKHVVSPTEKEPAATVKTQQKETSFFQIVPSSFSSYQ